MTPPEAPAEAGPNRGEVAARVPLPGRAPLVDASELARVLDVSRDWVYENAAELGAVLLGAGKKPRLRFDVDAVLERLSSCEASRVSTPPDPAPEQPSRRRRRARSGTRVDLLPVRGTEKAAS